MIQTYKVKHPKVQAVRYLFFNKADVDELLGYYCAEYYSPGMDCHQLIIKDNNGTTKCLIEGDWVIKNDKGDIILMSNKEFEETYEQD